MKIHKTPWNIVYEFESNGIKLFHHFTATNLCKKGSAVNRSTIKDVIKKIRFALKEQELYYVEPMRVVRIFRKVLKIIQ